MIFILSVLKLRTSLVLEKSFLREIKPNSQVFIASLCVQLCFLLGILRSEMAGSYIW